MEVIELCRKAGAGKLNVTAYCRVSTDLEEQQYSYRQQQEYYASYIARHSDWQFVGIYADEGLSGTSMKRRENFKRMMADARAGKIDYILVKSISRFARNTVDALSCTRMLKQLNPPVGVYFEKENIDTLDSRGELILTIMSALAQDESRSISDNVKWSLQKKFQRGEDVTNLNRMLGYTWDERHNWAIDETQAATVRFIYRRYLEGAGTTGIARELTARGLQTGSGGTVWRPGAVYRILTNEKYAGDCHLQKTTVRDLFSHISHANDGTVPSYYVRNHHDAIVDRATWNAVQAERRRRGQLQRSSEPAPAREVAAPGEPAPTREAASPGKPAPARQCDPARATVPTREAAAPSTRRHSGKTPFSSRLLCGSCGEGLIRRMWRVGVKDPENGRSSRTSGRYFTYPVWRCAAAERRRGAATCRAPGLMELSLEQSFMEYLYILRDRLLASLESGGDDPQNALRTSDLVQAFLKIFLQDGADLQKNAEAPQRLNLLQTQIRELEAHYNALQADAYNLGREESEEAPACAALCTEIGEALQRRKEEYDRMLSRQKARREQLESFGRFVEALLRLPEVNGAGMPLLVYGLNVHRVGTCVEDAPDILPFDAELFRTSVLRGCVMDDGRVAWEMRFGLTLAVPGNMRRFRDFYGFRRCVDGKAVLLDRAEAVVEALVK